MNELSASIPADLRLVYLTRTALAGEWACVYHDLEANSYQVHFLDSGGSEIARRRLYTGELHGALRAAEQYVVDASEQTELAIAP